MRKCAIMRSCFYKDVSFYMVEMYLKGESTGKARDDIEFLLHTSPTFREKLELYLVQKTSINFSMLQNRIQNKSTRCKIRKFLASLLKQSRSPLVWAFSLQISMFIIKQDL